MTADTCVFCLQIADNQDEKYFILRRFKHTVVMLNLYPYNGGHLLILPLSHANSLHALTADVRFEMMEVVTQSTQIMHDVLHAQGINVGINWEEHLVLGFLLMCICMCCRVGKATLIYGYDC